MKSNMTNTLAASAVVLGSACLLPSPLHAALYIAGSGAMLYSQVIPKLRHKIAQETVPICFDYKIINQNLVALSYSLPQCALAYATSSLFKQPLNDFLSTKIGNSSANQLIAKTFLLIIPYIGLNYLNGLSVQARYDNKLASYPITNYTPILPSCIYRTAFAVLFYAAGFDKNYGKVSAGLCSLMLLYTWQFCPERKDKKAAIMNMAPFIATIALSQTAIDILNLDPLGPLITLGKVHLQTTMRVAAESIVELAL